MEVAGTVALEEVGAQRGVDEREVGPQDAVVVEADHVVEGVGELLLDRLDPGHPRLRVGGEVVAARVEARLEEIDEVAGQLDVLEQGALDVVEGEGRVALAHVLGIGAQDRRLAPAEPGGEDEPVEAVALVVAVPHRAQRLREEGLRLLRQVAGVVQAELVDVGLAGQPLQGVGALVDDLDAHRGEHRQHGAQGERGPDTEDLQPGLATAGLVLVEQRQVDALLALDRLDPPEVG